MADVRAGVTRFISCTGRNELETCIASLHHSLQVGSGTGCREWLHPLQKAVLGKLNAAEGTTIISQLLGLADACFDCRQCSCQAQREDYLVLLYSYVKKLVSLKRLRSALKHGWQLLNSLNSLQTTSSKSSSSVPRSTLRDLLFGANLNVILCTHDLRQDVLAAVDGINQAAQSLLVVLRSRAPEAATQSADVLSKYLLQLAVLAGKEAAGLDDVGQQAASGGIQRLMLHLYLATGISSRPSNLPQVAVKALQALPDNLKACSITAALQAVGIAAAIAAHSDSKDVHSRLLSSHGSATGDKASSIALLPLPTLSAGVIVAVVQALLQCIVLSSDSAAACIKGLLSVPDSGQQLCVEICIILAVLYSKLPVDHTNRLWTEASAAVTAAAAALLSGVSIAKAGNPNDTGKQLAFAQQLGSMSLSAEAAPDSSQRSSSNRSSRGSKSKTANHSSKQWVMFADAAAACMQTAGVSTSVEGASAAAALEVRAWCLHELVDTALPGGGLALPCAAFAVCLIGWMMAVYTQCGSTPLPWHCAAKAAVYAARLLAEAPACSSRNSGSSIATSNSNRSNKQALQKQCDQQLADQQLSHAQVLHSLCTATNSLLGTVDMSPSCQFEASCPQQSAAEGLAGVPHNSLDCTQLQWLSWQLYSVARAAGKADDSSTGSSFAAVSSPTRPTRTDCCHSTGLPASLLLLAWQCSTAHLRKAVQLADQQIASSSAGGNVGEEQQPPEAAESGRTSANRLSSAITEVLHRAKAYCSTVLTSKQSVSSHNSDSADSQAQHVVGVTLQAVVPLIQEQLLQDSGSHMRRLEGLLRAFSRLRMSGTPAQCASSGSSGSNSRRRGRVQPADSQHDQQPQLASPSALQLLLQQEQISVQQQQQPQRDSTEGSIDRKQSPMPVDVLCWLECRTLLGLIHDSRLPDGAVIRAVQDLLQAMTTLKTPYGWNAAVLTAQLQLVKGIVLLQCPAIASSTATVAGIGSSNSEGETDQDTAAAAATLADCCRRFDALLLNGQAADGNTAATGSEQTSKKSKGSRSKAKGKQANSSTSAASMDSLTGPKLQHLCTPSVMQQLGPMGAVHVLASAALSHCLVGLAQVEAVVAQQRVGHGRIEGACIGNIAMATQEDGHMGHNSLQHGSSTGSSSDSGRAATWHCILQHWQHSGELFKVVTSTGSTTSAASNSCDSSVSTSTSSSALGAAIRFPTVAAAAASQALRVAGLQGCHSCQLAFAGVYAELQPAEQQFQQSYSLAMLQQQQHYPVLAMLLAPQQPWPASNKAAGNSSCCNASCASKPDMRTGSEGLAHTKAVEEPAGGSTLCLCQLQQAYQASEADLQGMQQLHDNAVSTGGWEVLQQAQVLLAACQAAAAAGNIAGALPHAESAVISCKRVLAATMAAANSSNMAVNGDKGVYWQAVGLCMSALLQLSELADASGNAADALRALRELQRLGEACHCCCMAALSSARISCIHSKIGDVHQANAAADAAEQWLQQWLSQQQQEQQHETMQLLCSCVAATVQQAKAACCLGEQQHGNAQKQLEGAITTIDAALEVQQQQLLQPVCLLTWRAAALKALLQLELSHCIVQTAGLQAASVVIREAVQQLDRIEVATCDRCCQTAWPAARAALLLQLHMWSAPRSPASSTADRLLHVVGCSSASRRCELQAEFASAAGDLSPSNQMKQQQQPTVHQATAAKSSGRKRRSRASQAQADTTVLSDISNGSSAVSKGEIAPLLSHDGAADPGAWLVAVLQELQHCAEQPLLLKDVCNVLSAVCSNYGAVQAAATFTQLSSGASLMEQQRLNTTSKLANAKQRADSVTGTIATDPAAADTGNGITDADCRHIESAGGGHLQAAAPSDAHPAPGCHYANAVVLQQVLNHLTVKPMLVELLKTATAASASQANAKAAGGSLTALLAAVDGVAGHWLQQQLSALTPGTAVCYIAAAQCIALPAAAAAEGADSCSLAGCTLLCPASANMVADSAKDTAGITVCRLLASASSDQQPPLPLVVTLQPPLRSSQEAGSIQLVLDELSDILADSNSSMQASTDLRIAAHKASWWKQRLVQDARMNGLLKQLDQQWLGPWRCLLVQPGSQDAEQAAAAAAEIYISEHFECVFEEQPRQLLLQLVALLLLHLDRCSASELQHAMRDLCQITQQRVDGLHLSKLVSSLQEAAAVIAKAAASSSMNTSKDAAHYSSDTSQAVGCSVSSKAARDAAADAHELASMALPVAAAAFLTPAAPKARSRLGRMQASVSAKKPPLSQSVAKSKGRCARTAAAVTAAGDNTAADEDGALAAMMLQKLQLEAESDAENDDNTDQLVDGRNGNRMAIVPASNKLHSAATTAPTTRIAVRRKVRFAEAECSEIPADENLCCASPVVPASMARHAVRRSRLPAITAGTPMTASSRSRVQAVTSAVTLLASRPAHSSNDCQVDAVSPKEGNRSPAAKPAATSTSTSSAVKGGSNSTRHDAWQPSVVLLLDGKLQQLPWESCAGLQQQQMYRCPNLAVAAAAAIRVRAMPSLSSSSSSTSNVLHLSSGFYLLNPDGDLVATQETFEGLLKQGLGLQGVCGSKPNSRQLTAALQQHDLYLYFGHGGGEQYVPLAALKRLNKCSGSLLMGCSSGRLRKRGVYESDGAIWAYLMAGCPAAVANLWDVTDRDSDRFAQSVLQSWTASSISDSADEGCNADEGGMSRKPRSNKDDSRRAPGCGQNGSVSNSTSCCSNSLTGTVDVSAAVAASRQACRLPSLIGAAAVCYGLPTKVAGPGQ